MWHVAGWGGSGPLPQGAVRGAVRGAQAAPVECSMWP